MRFLIENWYMIVAGICVVFGVVGIVKKFKGLSKDERYEQVRGWLLQAVILAEQKYGSGTGRMKLSAVYDAFCEALPWIAELLPFETFSQYVDDALDEVKGLLTDNKAIAALANTMIKEIPQLSEVK